MENIMFGKCIWRFCVPGRPPIYRSDSLGPLAGKAGLLIVREGVNRQCLSRFGIYPLYLTLTLYVPHFKTALLKNRHIQTKTIKSKVFIILWITKHRIHVCIIPSVLWDSMTEEFLFWDAGWSNSSVGANDVAAPLSTESSRACLILLHCTESYTTLKQ